MTILIITKQGLEALNPTLRAPTFGRGLSSNGPSAHLLPKVIFHHGVIRL